MYKVSIARRKEKGRIDEEYECNKNYETMKTKREREKEETLVMLESSCTAQS